MRFSNSIRTKPDELIERIGGFYIQETYSFNESDGEPFVICYYQILRTKIITLGFGENHQLCHLLSSKVCNSWGKDGFKLTLMIFALSTVLDRTKRLERYMGI